MCTHYKRIANVFVDENGIDNNRRNVMSIQTCHATVDKRLLTKIDTTTKNIRLIEYMYMVG